MLPAGPDRGFRHLVHLPKGENRAKWIVQGTKSPRKYVWIRPFSNFTGLVDKALQEAETQALAERVNAMCVCLERAEGGGEGSNNNNRVGEGSGGEIVGAGAGGGEATTAEVAGGEEGSASTGSSDDSGSAPRPLDLNSYQALMPDDLKRAITGYIEQPKFKLTRNVLATITRNRRERDTKMVEDWVEHATQRVLERCRAEAEQGFTHLEVLSRHDFDDLVGGRPAKCNFHSWGNDDLDIFTNGVKLVARKLRALGFDSVKCDYARGSSWPHTGALRVEWPSEVVEEEGER